MGVAFMELSLDSAVEIFALSQLFVTTRDALREYVTQRGEVAEGGARFLATTTLSHIEDMREGFRWVLRASDARVAELRYLLHDCDIIDCALDPESGWRTPRLYHADLRKVLALEHARTAFATMPRLPEQAVTFPAVRRSYWDIPVPSTPAALSDRIDELERGVWHTAAGKALEEVDLPLHRRVFAFFDAATWLAAEHARLFTRRRQPSA